MKDLNKKRRKVLEILFLLTIISLNVEAAGKPGRACPLNALSTLDYPQTPVQVTQDALTLGTSRLLDLLGYVSYKALSAKPVHSIRNQSYRDFAEPKPGNQTVLPAGTGTNKIKRQLADRWRALEMEVGSLKSFNFTPPVRSPVLLREILEATYAGRRLFDHLSLTDDYRLEHGVTISESSIKSAKLMGLPVPAKHGGNKIKESVSRFKAMKEKLPPALEKAGVDYLNEIEKRNLAVHPYFITFVKRLESVAKWAPKKNSISRGFPAF